MFTKTFRLLFLVGALFFSYKSYAQPAFIAQNVKGSCGGFNNGSFEVLVTAGTGSIEIFYFGGGPFFGGPIPATIGTPVTITGLAGAAFPGRPYTVIVQDGVSSANGIVNIINYPTPVTATIDDVDDNTNCTVSNGAISVTPSGGSGAYVYSWEETTLGFTASTQDISGLLGGNYELTITDINTNCITVLPPIAVANPSPVLFTITNPSPVIVCFGTSWILNLSGSESGATYEVFRNNLIATGITQVGTGSPLNFTIPFAAFANGDNFKVKATNGICVGDMTGIIVANKVPLPTATASGGGSVCAGSPLPNVTFTFTGTAPFTFTYTNGVTPVTVNNHPTTTYTITNAPAGTYQVTALTDANTCVATSFGSSASVIVNARPTAAISGGGAVCAGSALPNVTFTFTGTAPFTFTYTNGVTPVTITNHPSTTFTIANAPAGTYSITALTDATTCTATSLGTPVIVIVRPLPTVSSATGGGTLCAGGALPSVTFTFTGTPPFNLTYTDGVTPVIVNNHPTTTFTIPAAPAGAYRITALRDANNCVATSLGGTVNVVVNPLPTATISGGGPVCAGAPLPNVVFTFTGRAPFTFTYTNGVTPVTVNNHPTSTFTIANAPAGTYSVTALRDANTCVATSLGTPVTVTVNTLPTAVTSGGGTVCTGSPLPNVVFTFTGPAPYTFTYTNGTTPVTVTNHPTTTFTLTNAPAGTYRVTALTSANGCAATSLGGSVSVVVNPRPTATISGGGPVCAGAPLPNVVFTFTGTAPFTFTYTNGVTPVTVNNHPTSTFTIANAPAGTYSVTALTDANTCVATSFGTPVTVTVNALPTAVTSGGGTVCTGSPLPNVVFTFTGTAPFTFTYTNGTTPVTVTNHPTTTFTLTNAPAGTYRVTALTSANGCAATSLGGSVSVVVNPRPTATISGGGPVCAGAPLPNVVFTFTGTVPFTFTYTNGVTPVTVNNHPTSTFTIANAPAGTYSVTALTDANTCVATSFGTPVTVTVNALPTAVTSGGGTVCTGSPLPNVVFTFTGTAPFTFTYTNGTTPVTVTNHPTTTFTITNAPAGTYRVTALTSANGCAATSLGGSVSVVVSPRPTAAISGGGPVCAGAPLPNVVFTFTGTAPFTFTYTNGVTPVTVNNHPTTTFTIPNAPAGTYSVTALTDANTCVATSFGTPVSVTVNALPTASISGPATICTGGSATLTFTLPAGTYNVVYTDGTTNFNSNGIVSGATVSVSPAATTTYTIVSVTNPTTSCTVTAPSPNITGSALITVGPPPVLVTPQTKTICSGDNVAYEILLNPANLPVGTMFNWPDPDGAGPATAGVNVAMGAAGTTHINDVLTNATSAPIGVTYVVTPSTGGCAGTPRNVVITVNPTPVLATAQAKSICTGANVAYEIVLNPANQPAGTVFNWPDPDGAGPATAGVNVPMGAPGTTHINDVLTNATTAPITVTYVVTPSVGTCNGTPGNIGITVNPIPVLVTPQVKSICSGDNVDHEILLNPANQPAGTVFNWPDPDGAGPATAGVNVPMGPAGTFHIIDLLTNTSGAPLTLTYVVTPTNGTCAGVPRNVLVTVDPAPVLVAPQAKSICTGDNVAYEILLNPANLPVGTVFNWPDPDGAGPATAGVNVPMGVAGTIHINDVLTAAGATVTVTYVVTPRGSTGCVGSPQNIIITVNPIPVIAAGQTKTICSGANVGLEILMNPVNQPTGTVFNWPDPDGAGPATAGVNVAMGAAGTIHIDDALTNATAAPITVTYVVTPSVGTCTGAPVNVVITVDPFPAPVLVTPQAKTICSGDNVAYEILLNPANQPPGTLFNWPDPDGAGPATAGVNVAMGAAGTLHINDVLTNTTNAPISVMYVVTPTSASGCTGTSRNVAITINPAPVLATSQSKTICSGANVGYEILMNPLNQPTGTVFNWPDPDGAGPATAGVNVTMGAAGTIHIDDALTNATAAPITVTYVVTPSVGTCIGAPENIVITVDPFPAPVLVTPQTKTICSGDNVAYEILLNPANQPPGTLFNWPDPDGAGPATAGVNVAMGAAGTLHINDVLTNTTNAPIIVTYAVTPASGSGCVGTTRNVIITVNPSPVLATSQSKTICSGANVGYEILMNPLNQPTGTVFNWPDPDGAGPATAGVNVAMGAGGTIHIDDALTNATAAPITVTYVVTPSVGTCTGAPEDVDIIVDPFPAPVLVTPQAKTICSGDNVAYEILLNPANQPPGTLFNWPDPDGTGPATAGVNVAMGAAGTLHINDILTNTTNAPITVTYIVTPNSASGCAGTSRNVTITVNPAPVLATSQNTSICSGNVVGYEILLNPLNQPIGTVFNWPDPDGAGPATAGVNVAMGAAGTIHINDVLTNTSGSPITVTYTVTPSVGSCVGAPQNVVVTVRDAASPFCTGGGTDCTNFSSIQPTIVTQPSCNDRDAGEVSFTVARTDGTPTTFRIVWTTNGTTQTKFTSSTVSFNDLSSGLYKYTVTDEGNGKSCGPVDFFLDLKTQVEILDKQVTSNVTCFGGSDGNVILSVDGSTTGEYWYKYVLDGVESGSQTFTPGAPLPGGLPADDNDFIIIKVDETFAFSCPDTVMVRIKHTYAKIDFTVASTEVTTCNGTDGAIQVAAIGGGDSGANALQIRLKMAVPFSTDPSGYIVLVDYEDVAAGAKEYTTLAQGNYVVDVKDHLDCIQSKPIAVQAPGQVPLSTVGIVATDATCTNEGESGSIKVTISDPGIYKVALSQDQANVPADDQFVDYNSPSLPSFTFNNLGRGIYYLYLKSSTTTCPTRTDAIAVGGVQAIGDFDIVSSCDNVNITANNITGQQDAPFVIRVFSNSDKFFKIDSLSSSNIPLSNSVSFIYSAPLQHSFLINPGTYRFVMVQVQTTGAGSCTLVSDTVVYNVRQGLGIVLGEIKPSFPEPKRTGSIEIENIDGGTRFVSDEDELYYEISLSTADDDIVIFDWEEVKLNPQNKFSKLFDFLLPGVYRIKVRDASGCVKTQDVEISLDPSVYVPNIFTPNDDSANDQFEVLNLPLTGKHKLIVTNRWGNEVFKSNDYREGTFWDGNETSDGIYFYRLQVEGGDTYTGWVEIMRGTKP